MEDIITKFKPATYRPGKDSHISYYAYDPNEMKLKRIKKRLNHIDPKIRKRYAVQVVNDLNDKLFRGWNPLNKITTNKGVKLNDAIKCFIETKQRELRPASMRSYVSLCKYLVHWMSTNNMDVTPQQFERAYTNRLMNELGQTRGLRTYNSYLGLFKNLFNWMVENEYCKENPFDHHKKKQVEEKDRQVIAPEHRQKIWSWLEHNEPNLQMVAALIYYCFIRPKEISFLKPTHFDLVNGTIYIPGEASKNRKGQRVTIPNEALHYMKQWFEQRDIAPEHYIVSNQKTFAHGKGQMDSRYFSRPWNRMKKTLDLPNDYQLYSMKDTGIVQMLEDGVPPNEVMIQARHHDLSVTTEYLKHTSRAHSQHGVKTKTTSFS